MKAEHSLQSESLSHTKQSEGAQVKEEDSENVPSASDACSCTCQTFLVELRSQLEPWLKKGEFIKKPTETDNINFKLLFQDKFLFYTQEDSEIINGNICKSGELLNSSNICTSCSIECGTLDKCSSNLNCKIFCETNCIADKNETTKCGGTTEDDVVPLKQKQKEIKTPIEEETNIPDFTIIFKYAIKIFFILIVLYIAYMFYKIFNESILTFGNIFYGFFDWLFYLFSNNIKKAEHYENIIQDKYNTIIRKTMT